MPSTAWIVLFSDDSPIVTPKAAYATVAAIRRCDMWPYGQKSLDSRQYKSYIHLHSFTDQVKVGDEGFLSMSCSKKNPFEQNPSYGLMILTMKVCKFESLNIIESLKVQQSLPVYRRVPPQNLLFPPGSCTCTAMSPRPMTAVEECADCKMGCP